MGELSGAEGELCSQVVLHGCVVLQRIQDSLIHSLLVVHLVGRDGRLLLLDTTNESASSLSLGRVNKVGIVNLGDIDLGNIYRGRCGSYINLVDTAKRNTICCVRSCI